MTDDIGSYRPCVLPSPKLFARMLEERDRKRERTIDDATRSLEGEIGDALFDESLDRKIKALAA